MTDNHVPFGTQPDPRNVPGEDTVVAHGQPLPSVDNARLARLIDCCGRPNQVGAQHYTDANGNLCLDKELATELLRELQASRALEPQQEEAVAVTPKAVAEAMREAWDEICSDTGCHPDDIVHGKDRYLEFNPGHWAALTAKRLGAHPTPVQKVQESQTVSVNRDDLALLLARPSHGWVEAKARLEAKMVECLKP